MTELLVTCWCECHAQRMTVEEVRTGVGWSCGARNCTKALSQELSAARRKPNSRKRG